MDDCSLNEFDLRCARLLLRSTAYQKIPCYVDITDGETLYSILMVVEDDWIDLPP